MILSKQHIQGSITQNKNIGFFILFALFCLNNLYWQATSFLFDSLSYYNLSTEFGSALTFTPLHFTNSTRGYLFPLLLNFLFRIASIFQVKPTLFYALFSAFYLAFVFAKAIPMLVATVFNYTITFKAVLYFSALVIVFWGGYLPYPLTDFYSITFILLATILLFSKKIGWLFLSGVLIAAAINFRPSYMFCSFLFIVCISVLNYKATTYTIILKTCLVAFGMFLVFVPQMAYNYVQHRNVSPFVQVNKVGYATNKSVIFFHLSKGLEAFKYETTTDSRFSSPKVYYTLPNKLKLIAKTTEIKNWNDYFSVVLQNPINVAGIYALHFTNAFFQTSNQVYISELKLAHKPSLLYHLLIVLTNAILFYFFVMSCISNKNMIKHPFVAFLVVIVLISSFINTPTVVETRYFLPFYFCMYAIIVLMPLKNIFENRSRLFYTANTILFFATVFAFWVLIEFHEMHINI